MPGHRLAQFLILNYTGIFLETVSKRAALTLYVELRESSVWAHFGDILCIFSDVQAHFGAGSSTSSMLYRIKRKLRQFRSNVDQVWTAVT